MMGPNFRQNLLAVLLSSVSFSVAAQTTKLSESITWTESDNAVRAQSSQVYYIPEKNGLPLFHRNVPTPIESKTSIILEIRKIRVLNFRPPYYDQLTSEFNHQVFKRIQSKKGSSEINISAARKNEFGQVELLGDFVVSVEQSPDPAWNGRSSYKRGNKIDSKLKDGTWYKIGVSETGIYRIDRKFLDDNGIDVSSFNASEMAIYGYGGRVLSEVVGNDERDDLMQIATLRSGLDDGRFDNNDYLLFYAEGPISWTETADGKHIRHELHPYTNGINYFIHLNTDKPLSAKKVNVSGSATHSSSTYTYVETHHVDRYTEISKHVKTGKQWFGEDLGLSGSENFSISVPDIITSSPISFRSFVAERHIGGANSIIDVAINGNSVVTHSIPATYGESDDPYANVNTARTEATVGTGNLSISYSYQKPNAQANAWLNYFEVNAKSELKYKGSPLSFRDLDLSDADGDIIEYSISASTSLNVWKVTDINNIESYSTSSSNGKVSFKTAGTGNLESFIAFENSDGSSPSFIGKVNNQNIHGLSHASAFIVYHKNFKQAAEELAQFHRDQEGVTVNVVDIAHIYNEFSSGHQDISAIRNMMSYFYQTASGDEQLPKYLLLIGDASYDFKDRIPDNTNFVPTYQSDNSWHFDTAHSTDDYFGLLDDGEGIFVGDAIDLAIGRFPVQTSEEALQVVSKIKAYYKSKTLRSWRNDVCFIADDEDSNRHINDTEDLAKHVESNHPVYNVKKIYFDSYVQEASAGGSRYPDVERRINEIMESGALVVNYMGHGGELGWAHERVLELDDINAWSNIESMPLMVTATCEFTRFDDPSRVSAGEQVFLNPKGGAIAMLTTTRLVYAHQNKSLLDALFKDNIFSYEGYDFPTIGETIQRTKASFPSLIVGYRKFALIGDPIMTLAYPKEQVQTTSVNGVAVSESSVDTFKALTKVSIEGRITDLGGNTLSNYNGIVYPTIFDKPDTLLTLKNDDASFKKKFAIQKNVLYKGKATVTNGEFTFEFVVPKDISYKFGQGKISYYTENEEIDGNGFFTGFVIGGTGESQIEDNEGPQADLFVNDLQFAFGGLTDENPVLIGVLNDDNGINTVGTSIGHELTLQLDDEDPIIVNEYYESELDDYTSGKITYPYVNLEEGRHSVTLVAWDVANNSTTAYTEFVVSNSAKLALDHVLNYPNPFTTNTTFRFDHNKPGDILDVSIQIFNVSGRIVRTFNTQVVTTGSTFSDISWDGTDDFGNNIGKGVYVYRIQVRSSDGNSAEEIEKLVLLR